MDVASARPATIGGGCAVPSAGRPESTTQCDASGCTSFNRSAGGTALRLPAFLLEPAQECIECWLRAAAFLDGEVVVFECREFGFIEKRQASSRDFRGGKEIREESRPSP